jgi:hypothetical protein
LADKTQQRLEIPELEEINRRYKGLIEEWKKIVDERHTFDIGKYGPANPEDDYAKHNIEEVKKRPPGYMLYKSFYWQGMGPPSNVKPYDWLYPPSDK